MENWILMIFIIPGALSRGWSVIFEDQCALKGTSVVMKCIYDYPILHIVQRVEWSRLHEASGVRMLTPLTRLPSPRGQFKYVGDYSGNCNLQINDVQQNDEGQYYFSFRTTLNRWTSKTSARLDVKELTAVLQPSTVTEGDTVRLTCRSGCSTRVTIVWFRDGERVLAAEFPARIEDAGTYFCAVPGLQKVRSASVPLTVHYAPRNVALSVIPPGDVVAGGSVTFTCSSDANPPVDYGAYSLYKEGRFISSGQNHTVADVRPGHSGVYHCQAWNSISRSGVDLMNSTPVLLNVLHGPMNLSIAVDPPQVTQGSGVNLTCSGEANPPADNYTWYMRYDSPGSSSMTQVGSGQVLSLASMAASHVGLYSCRAWNSVGVNFSPEILLSMTKEDRGSQTAKIVGGVGLVAFVILAISLLLLWKKQRTYAKEKNAPTLGEASASPTAKEGQADSIYANVSTFQPPPAQNGASHRGYYAASYDEAQVTYSTVTVKPRSSRRAPRDTRSTTAKQDISVIYTTMSESRP